jgi:hypothetical protein
MSSMSNTEPDPRALWRSAWPAGVPAAISWRKATDSEVLAWSERHDLRVSLSVAREIFEDAQTLALADVRAPSTDQGEKA